MNIETYLLNQLELQAQGAREAYQSACKQQRFGHMQYWKGWGDRASAITAAISNALMEDSINIATSEYLKASDKEKSELRKENERLVAELAEARADTKYYSALYWIEKGGTLLKFKKMHKVQLPDPYRQKVSIPLKVMDRLQEEMPNLEIVVIKERKAA